jgi:putrescine transport system permease protein
MSGRGESRGRRLVALVPLAWLAATVLAPFLIMLGISFSESIIANPPYAPLVTAGENGLAIHLHLDNYRLLLEDPLYLAAYIGSLRIAGISTLLCLALGYPMAYAIARARPTLRTPLLMLVVLPFWTSFLIRVYAWMGILNTNGLANQLLMALGLTDQPLALLHTNFAVYLGITYSYLPFMVLPLYSILEKLDPHLLEAAEDLGCTPFRAFLRVTLPLSMRGVLAGALLVFVPAVGEFVIPDLLGGPDTLMIGKVLWTEFFDNRDWPLASALAVALALLVVLPVMLLRRRQYGLEGAAP